jgi:dihydropteroate synthase
MNAAGSLSPIVRREPLSLSRLLTPDRTLVMGILNVTPDSFSDGGHFFDPQQALPQAERMISEGADIIDIGAESTRPYGGAEAVPIEEELARLKPVLPAATALGRPVSIDTIKARVASWAIEAGAGIVNDVWGLQRDTDMAAVVAEHGVPVILMHNREKADASIDIVGDVIGFFQRSLDIAARAGIVREQIALDPGIGFGKTPEQSITVIARLAEFKSFGLPLLVGLSRKRFINTIVPSDADQRLGGSIAGHLLAVLNGAAIVRTHDVADTVQALRVAEAIRRAR